MFDSHAHYDDKRFDTDRETLLVELENDPNIEGVLNAAVDTSSSVAIAKIARDKSKFFASAGVHPHEAADVSDDYLELIHELLKEDKVVAIGEIGLDYHYDFVPRDEQKKVFDEQLCLAEELDVPVIIHDREAHADCLEAISRHTKARGVFHSYSGSVETAKFLLSRGWYLSFNGIITFKNAARPRSVVEIVPDDRLLVETDCPYLTPVPHRGKRNDSSYMKYTIEEMAKLRGQTYQHIEKITTENTKRLFDIN